MPTARGASGLEPAVADEARRKAAVDETLATLAVAAAVPYQVLVVHCGVPDPRRRPRTTTAAARCVRSLEELSPSGAAAGVRLAIEVIPNELSTPSALVDADRKRPRSASSASAWTSATRG